MKNYLNEFHFFSVKDDILSAMMNHIDDISSLPIVSVGSGCGHLEASLIHHSNQSLKIITIDPDPYSFPVPSRIKYETLMPQFASVDDLINDQPSIVSQNILLLAWPTPIDSTYDYDAIRLLQPVKIISIYELLGAAGGNPFHGFLSSISDSLSKNPSMITQSDCEMTMKKYYPSLVHKRFNQPDPNDPYPRPPSKFLRWGILALIILDSSNVQQEKTKTIIHNQPPDLTETEFAFKVFHSFQQKFSLF